MNFSFPDLPPRSHDRPSFRRYALRRRDVEGVYAFQEAAPRARNAVYAALALVALVMGLLWAFEGRSEPAPEIRLIPLLTADTL